MAKTLHNLLKTLHKFVLINLLGTVYSEYSLNLYMKNLNNNKYNKDE